MNLYSFLEFLNLPIHSDEIQNSDEFAYVLTGSPASVGNTRENQEYIDKVKIPMIQRDYAQGREDKKELREEFVDDLFKAIEKNEELKLDFIYGSIRNDKEKTFLPLDGQQRITTLFLLYWFLLKTESKSNQDLEKKLLLKFSYETRNTARLFFQTLIEFDFEGNPKESIQKSHWFKNSYQLDPTIISSLNMLDTIFHRYQSSTEKGNLVSRLNNIRFYVLPMNNFNLSDDLYIKLNARGKTLSPFENFKADLIGWLNKQEEFTIIRGDGKLTRLEEIASKFDNDWAHLFWRNVNNFNIEIEDKKVKSIDSYFFKFIHRLLINDYIINFKGSDILKNDIYIELTKKENKILFSNIDFYTKNSLVTLEFISNLQIILDFYSDKNNLEIISGALAPAWPVWEDGSKWSIFKDGSFTMNDRMLFDAINQYILTNSDAELNIERFKEWIRIVWNLIIDPDIRSIEASKTVMTVIRNISHHSGNIYNSLIQNKIDDYIASINNIHKAQLQEEKIKAEKIMSSLEWEKAIIEAESHKLFSGNIGFLLSNISSADELKNRFLIADSLFKPNGANEVIPEQRYTLMRCVLSEIDKWDSILWFNFSDNEINWKTYLRRNENIKNVIGLLVNLENLEQVKDYINKCISRNSILDIEDKKKLHQTLYLNNEFHIWMQENAVNKIKWLGSHYFVIRPSAWYRKVMIDCFRNEITTELVRVFNINKLNDYKCGDSNYFMGETIVLQKVSDNQCINFDFDNNSSFIIGLKRESNLNIEVNKEEAYNVWIESFKFCYTDIKRIEDIPALIQQIKTTLANSNHIKII